MHPVTALAETKQPAPEEFLLRLGDNALILSHRLSEWTGHGPALEEDIALTNTALDLLGQARMLYSHAGQNMQPACDEDALAYWRNAEAFRNFTALELPNSGVHAARGALGDYAFTMVRQSLFSAYMLELWPLVAESADEVLAGIAMKSIKETRYHWRHASDWTIRLGDGTEVSNKRMQQALEQLFPYTNEWFTFDAIDERALGCSAHDLATQLRDRWFSQVDALCKQSHLRMPASSQLQTRGRFGVHGEHLSLLLAEMQSVARAHPGASW